MDKEYLLECKIHSTILRMIANKMETDPSPTRPPAKNKWLEMVEVGGTRYGVTCHREGNTPDQDKTDMIVITFVRPSRKA